MHSYMQLDDFVHGDWVLIIVFMQSYMQLAACVHDYWVRMIETCLSLRLRFQAGSHNGMPNCHIFMGLLQTGIQRTAELHVLL